MSKDANQRLRLGLPKGRMQAGVFELLAGAGIDICSSSRGYRPGLSIENIESKVLKPQNIVEMLQSGSRDAGFAGADWVEELGLDNPQRELVELLDTGLNPVQIVVAAPTALLENGSLPDRRFVVASEYERLTKDWISRQKIDATFVRSFGATEVFPPEDADIIVDNTATGTTLRENNLQIIEVVATSSTRFYASRDAMDNPKKRIQIDDLKMLFEAVLEGRKRAMIEVNVSQDCLENVISALPAMQRPTVAPLFGNSGYAVRAAVLRSQIPLVIPELKARGGRDVVVSNLSQIVP